MKEYTISANWPGSKCDISAESAGAAMLEYAETLDAYEVGDAVALEASREVNGEWIDVLVGVYRLTDDGWETETTILPDNLGPLESDWLPLWQSQG